jgi:ATP-dependent Clp protease adapter protein ClpS
VAGLSFDVAPPGLFEFAAQLPPGRLVPGQLPAAAVLTELVPTAKRIAANERATEGSPRILDRPESEHGTASTSGSSGWIVTVYNNAHNTWEEVIHILMVATSCSEEEAVLETWEVDNLGRSVVHHSDQGECEQVAAVIAQIGIEVRVSEE